MRTLWEDFPQTIKVRVSPGPEPYPGQGVSCVLFCQPYIRVQKRGGCFGDRYGSGMAVLGRVTGPWPPGTRAHREDACGHLGPLAFWAVLPPASVPDPVLCPSLPTECPCFGSRHGSELWWLGVLCLPPWTWEDCTGFAGEAGAAVFLTQEQAALAAAWGGGVGLLRPGVCCQPQIPLCISTLCVKCVSPSSVPSDACPFLPPSAHTHAHTHTHTHSGSPLSAWSIWAQALALQMPVLSCSLLHPARAHTHIHSHTHTHQVLSWDRRLTGILAV